MGGSREPFVILRTLPRESRRLLSLSGIKVSGARLILEGSSGINLCWNANLRQVRLDGVVADSLPTSSVCEVDNSEALFLFMPSGVGSQKNFSGRILIPACS